MRMKLLFSLLLFASVVAEFFVLKYVYFPWEEVPLFYAAFGFAAFVLFMLGAKYVLLPIVRRGETYYDD